MPIDIVIWFACAAGVWLLVDWWLRGVDAKRLERHFDPDDWPAHLGLPSNFKARERTIEARPKRRKSA